MTRGSARVIAVVLFVLGIILILLAAYGLISMVVIMFSSGFARLDIASSKTVRITAPFPNPFQATLTKPLGTKHYSPKDKRTHVLLTFAAYKVLPTDGKLAGDLKIEVPVSLKERFEPKLSRIVGCPEGTTGSETRLRLEEDYADKNLVVRVRNEIGPHGVKIPIPFEDFLSSSIDRESETCEQQRDDIINHPDQLRIPAELPILSGPIRNYPSDYQQLSAIFQVKLPKGLSLDTKASGSEASSAILPCIIQMRSSPGLAGRTISLLKPEASLPLPRSLDEPRITATNVDARASVPIKQIDTPQQGEEGLRLLLIRDWNTQLLVYLGAFLPFVWLVIIMCVLLTFVHRQPDRTTGLREINLNLALATLSVLPLRAVLVPSDLQGLTRIDYLLVLQLLLIIAAALLLNSVQLWSIFSTNDMREREHEN
jgi:hypothetical protein